MPCRRSTSWPTARFQPVIGEVDALDPRRSSASSLLGKVYYDLLAAAVRKASRTSRIVRLEQLYPFPTDEVAGRVPSIRTPRKSSGARKSRATRAPGTGCFAQHLGRAVGGEAEAALVARPASASPAVGYYAKHNAAENRHRSAFTAARVADPSPRQQLRQESHAYRSESSAVVRVRRRSHAGSLAQESREAVARDENLIDIETDKVVLETPAPDAGVLVKIIKGDGETWSPAK
jgi:hypothetical protein